MTDRGAVRHVPEFPARYTFGVESQYLTPLYSVDGATMPDAQSGRGSVAWEGGAVKDYHERDGMALQVQELPFAIRGVTLPARGSSYVLDYASRGIPSPMAGVLPAGTRVAAKVTVPYLLVGAPVLPSRARREY